MFWGCSGSQLVALCSFLVAGQEFLQIQSCVHCFYRPWSTISVFSGGANPTRSDSCFYPVPHTLDVLALTSAALWLSVLCLMLQVGKAAVFSRDNWVLRCRGERAGSWEKSQLVLICIPAPQNSLETSSAVDCTGMMGEGSSESHARAKRDS